MLSDKIAEIILLVCQLFWNLTSRTHT